MFLLRKGFFLELPRAGLLIGGMVFLLGLVYTPLGIFFLIRTLFQYNEEDTSVFVQRHQHFTIFGLLSVIGYGIAFLITSTSLIVGILKNKEQYLLPWLSFNIFLIVVRILLLLTTLPIMSQSPYIFILYILLTSLAVYIFFCIVSLYELMKANASEKEQNSREADTISVDSEH